VRGTGDHLTLLKIGTGAQYADTAVRTSSTGSPTYLSNRDIGQMATELQRAPCEAACCLRWRRVGGRLHLAARFLRAHSQQGCLQAVLQFWQPSWPMSRLLRWVESNEAGPLQCLRTRASVRLTAGRDYARGMYLLGVGVRDADFANVANVRLVHNLAY